MRIRHGVLIGVLVLTPVLVATPSEAAAGSCAGRIATIRGTSGDDTMSGTPLPDVVSLGGGDDRFSDLGGAGKDFSAIIKMIDDSWQKPEGAGSAPLPPGYKLP